MMVQPPLPAFIVIGAAKAATTWIAHQLRERSDVFMPGPEPHYFSREYVRGDAWYASLFASAHSHQLIGEKSADYLADPQVPARIARLLPQAKLIAQLRNPVERAYSDYCMLFRRGRVNDDIDRHLDWDKTEVPRFLADGLYGRHIARFRDHFPAERLKIILHDDIISTPEAVLKDVCTGLGLTPIAEMAMVAARLNDRQAPLVPFFLRRLPEPIKKVIQPLRRHSAFVKARRMIAKPVQYPPLVESTRRRLEDFYRDDVIELGRVVGRDLEAWLQPACAEP